MCLSDRPAEGERSSRGPLVHGRGGNDPRMLRDVLSDDGMGDAVTVRRRLPMASIDDIENMLMDVMQALDGKGCN